MNRLLPIIVSLLSITLSSNAQSTTALLEKYKNKVNSLTNQYDRKVSASRAEFLKKTWTMKQQMAGREDPFSRKGDAGAPSKVEDTGNSTVIIDKGKVDIINIVPEKPKPTVRDTSPKDVSADDERISFRFYGRTYSVRFSRQQRFEIGTVSEERLSEVWEHLNAAQYQKTIDDCLEIKETDCLCDWAYLCLVDSLSKSVFPSETNERQLMFGHLISRSGFSTRFGMENNRLHALFGVSTIIYGRPYFTVDGIDFFATDNAPGKMQISDLCDTDTHPVSMLITRPQKLGGNKRMGRHVTSENGIEFDYSMCRDLAYFYFQYPHISWTYKAKSTVSNYMKQIVYPEIRRKIEGMNQIAAANEILRFVGTSREYRQDDQFWGMEKWNFPDESCLYPYGDCDDYAILFCRLIHDMLGLETLLVNVNVDGGPHLTTAVRFTEPLEGDKMVYDGKTFYFCEPTATFTKVGQRCWKQFEVQSISQF